MDENGLVIDDLPFKMVLVQALLNCQRIYLSFFGFVVHLFINDPFGFDLAKRGTPFVAPSVYDHFPINDGNVAVSPIEPLLVFPARPEDMQLLQLVVSDKAGVVER